MPVWTWAVTIASIIGTIANIYKKRWGFAVWFLTNVIWCFYDYLIHQYSQSILFGVYAGLAIWGLYRWKDDNPGEE